jgi:hypothetical protein
MPPCEPVKGLVNPVRGNKLTDSKIVEIYYVDLFNISFVRSAGAFSNGVNRALI